MTTLIESSGPCPSPTTFVLRPGMVCFRTDTKQRYVWDGTAWQLLGGVPNLTGATPSGPVLPATCALGDVFTLTAGDVGLYTCAFLPNMWEKTGQVGSVRFLHQEPDPVLVNYRQWLLSIANDPETTLAKAVTLAGGPAQMEAGGAPVSFLTPAGEPGAHLILAGTWEFMLYLGVSAPGGVSTVVAHVFKRAADTTETDLFTVTSEQVTVAGPALFDFETVQPQIALDPTDRLGVRFFAQTTVVAGRTLTLFYEGAVHYSHVHLPLLGL